MRPPGRTAERLVWMSPGATPGQGSPLGKFKPNSDTNPSPLPGARVPGCGVLSARGLPLSTRRGAGRCLGICGRRSFAPAPSGAVAVLGLPSGPQGQPPHLGRLLGPTPKVLPPVLPHLGALKGTPRVRSTPGPAPPSH